jgi:hypothetical protein
MAHHKDWDIWRNLELSLDKRCHVDQDGGGRACVSTVGFCLGRPTPTTLVDSRAENSTAG